MLIGKDCLMNSEDSLININSQVMQLIANSQLITMLNLRQSLAIVILRQLITLAKGSLIMTIHSHFKRNKKVKALKEPREIDWLISNCELYVLT